MTRAGRLQASVRAASLSFLRRRTAVFFTFLFPVLIVVIFGALVQTQPTGGGLFSKSSGYYVPGYLGVVVLFTPLSRVGSEVARHREGNRFEKLATTPLRRWEWLLAQTIVNVLVIGVAALALLALLVGITGADIAFSPLLVPFVVLGVTLFCGVGALIGAFADSQDGVIAASNALALPLIFLSETFVSPDLLPKWFRPFLGLSPLTYFSRGVRAATLGWNGALVNLAIVTALALIALALGAVALPQTD